MKPLLPFLLLLAKTLSFPESGGVMDTENGTQIIDAIGKPLPKPQGASPVASPINLLNPDRYEFFTFNDNGDLVKRLMTLEEIQGIIANGDGEDFNYNVAEYLPEKKVNDIVSNVQNVLKEQMVNHKQVAKPILDTPDVSNSWSMILPAFFGNTGEEITPEKISDDITTKIKEFEKLTTPLYASNKPNSSLSLVTSSSPSTSTRIPPTTTSSPNKISSTSSSTQISSSPSTKISSTSSSTQISSSPSTKISATSSSTQISSSPSTKISSTSSSTKISSTTSSSTKISSSPSTKVSSSPSIKISASTTSPSTTNSPSSTSSTPINELKLVTETQSSPNLITVAIISDTKYNITNLGGTNSPMVTILPFNSTTPKISTSTKLDEEESKITQSLSDIVTDLVVEKTKISEVPTKINDDLDFLTSLKSTPSTSPEAIKSSIRNENDFSTWSSIKIESTTPSINPLTTPLQETLTTEALKVLLKEELPEMTINSLASLKSTTPIWIIIKRKPEKGEENNVKIAQKEEIKTVLSQNEEITENPELKNMPLLNEFAPFTHSPLTTKKINEINLKLSTKLPESVSEKISEIVTEEVNGDVESTTLYTTQQSLMESVHQLLSQTVNDVDEPILNVDANKKIEEMLMGMNEKPMQDLQDEVATIGSAIGTKLSENGNVKDEDTKIENTTSIELEPTTTLSVEEVDFSEALSSVLSQIYSLDDGTTPLADLTTERVDETTRLSEANELSTMTVDLETTTSIDVEEETQTNLVPSTIRPNFDAEIELDQEESKNTTNFIFYGANESSTIPYGEKLMPKETTLKIKSSTILPIMLPTISPSTSPPISSLISPSTSPPISSSTSPSTSSSTSPSTSPPISSSSPQISSSTSPPNLSSTIPSPSSLSKPQPNKTATFPEKLNSWTLVSTIIPSPPPTKQPSTTPPPIKLPNQPFHGFGLEETTSRLDTDVYQFVELCNELSFGFWSAVTNGISSARSIFVSPFAATSLLAMVFLGARGATSGEMNDILKLDDMVTFNPHLIFKNVSESIEAGKGSGVAVSVIARELYSDRGKGKLLSFYKERAKQFYDGFVEEVSFKEIGDVVRRRTNLIVKKNSGGKIQEYLKDSSIILRPPLAGVSASVFETDCSQASTEGRDGELHFVVLPSIRQRKLVPIPAAVYRSGFLAGYDPQLDATAAAIGGPDQTISTIFVIPGQQGIAAPGDGLLRLEKQLSETAFKKGSWGRV
nr:uncharacterized protein LOC111417060 [Onthophagus taurus]